MTSPYLLRPTRTLRQALADRDAARGYPQPRWPMSKALALWIAACLLFWVGIVLGALWAV